MFTSTKQKPYLLFTMCLLLAAVLFTTSGIALAGEKSAAEPISTIILKQEPDSILPLHLKTKLGTTLVFLNNDAGPVTIKFLDKLGIACKAPVNFYADLWGNYETAAITQGGTASLCFIYKGTYKYEVKRLITVGDKSVEQIAVGTITAEE
jgi:hypothetical protein